MVLGQTPGWRPSGKGGHQPPGRGPRTPSPSRAPSGKPASGVPPWRSKTMAGRPSAPRTFMMKSAVNAQAARVDPSMASAMRNLNINQTKVPPAAPPDCYDPSMGPPPAEDEEKAWQGSACPTINSTMSTYNVAIFNKTCKRTKRTIDDFKLGQIIAVPHHVPNLNPKNTANHPRLTLTCEGPVFSKRRLLAVLFKHQSTLFCLALWSFEGRGLDCKPDKLKFEYVSVMNKGEKKFRNMGKFQPVEVETYDSDRPMKDTSCIQLTGGVHVDPSEHVSFVGRMDQASYSRLLTLYERRNEIAKQKPWEPDEPKPKA